MKNVIFGPDKPVQDRIALPSSKSISNRMLIIKALSGSDARLINLSQSDDTNVLKQALEENLEVMPETVQHMAPYMITDNWLLSYREVEGIHRVLKGLNRRTGLKSGMDQAVEELEDFYGEFQTEFTAFFDELIIFSRQKIATL